MKRLLSAFACAVILGALACGSSNSPSTPTTPSTPTPPAPTILPASLQLSGQGSWSLCSFGDCLFSASIQNNGSGCASGTAVVARFYDANNAQMGSDVQMGTQGGLSVKVIRPNEIVAITSTIVVASNVVSGTKTYRLFPTWNDVQCP
jgi:hypothetical protein